MSALPLDSFTLAACVADVARASEATAADAIEFRMDHAQDPLEHLAAYDESLPIIATNRAHWEGGEAPDEGRIDVLEQAVSHPSVVAVDIELESVTRGEGDALREAARRHDTTVIVSWHDFSTTPPQDELHSQLDAAVSWGDVGKIAVTAESLDDVLNLLLVTREQTRAGNAVSTMSMGQIGRHSRVIAPLYGSTIGYAPITSDEATAPGQLPLAELADLLDALGG